jgi:glyoxylate reductase
MKKPRLFVTQPVEQSALARLQAEMEVTVHPDSSRSINRQELLNAIRENEYLFCRLGDVVDAEIIDANPELKLIATMTTAAAQIDLAAATQKKIPVLARKTPRPGDIQSDSIFEETADMTWALLLSLARQVVEGDKLIRAGVFPGPHSLYLVGSQVFGKTLGIIGLGKIGQAVARRAVGFRMNIIYFSPKRSPEAELEFGLRYRCLEELLAEADFVSLHPSYNKETHHLIGNKELAAMKRTAFLINTSRGPVVHQDALIQALREKRIAGAALDVFEDEPYPVLPEDFTAMKNVVFTPHLGSAVAEKREIMTNAVVDNILSFLKGNIIGNILNPEALER